MAHDDDKPTTRKRTPRKKSPATKPPADQATTPPDPDSAKQPPAANREVMTTEAAAPATTAPDGDTQHAPDREQLNRFTYGELVVHYPERDVTFVLDGHTAAKVMSVHAGTGSRRRLQDPLAPDESNMANLWASIDIDRPLAMSWYPGLGAPSMKMTVDPPKPQPA